MRGVVFTSVHHIREHTMSVRPLLDAVNFDRLVRWGFKIFKMQFTGLSCHDCFFEHKGCFRVGVS